METNEENSTARIDNVEITVHLTSRLVWCEDPPRRIPALKEQAARIEGDGRLSTWKSVHVMNGTSSSSVWVDAGISSERQKAWTSD